MKVDEMEATGDGVVVTGSVIEKKLSKRMNLKDF